MSIKRMTEVWEKSYLEKSGLLVLLSIADHAADDGFAWPSVKRLAKRSRVSERQVSRVVQEAQDYGELYIHVRQGRVNQYLVLVGQTEEEIIEGLEKRFNLSEIEIEAWLNTYYRSRHPVGGEEMSPPTPMSEGNDTHVGTPPTPMSSESLNNPLKNHQKEKIYPFPNQEKYLDALKMQLNLDKQAYTAFKKMEGTYISDYSKNGDGIHLKIACQTDEQRDWLNGRMINAARRMLTGFFDEEVKLEFVTEAKK